MGCLKRSSLMLGLCSLLVAGTAQASCVGDVNGDGAVDVNDMVAVLANYGASASAQRKLAPAQPDQNKDKLVNAVDLAIVQNNMGGECQACPHDFNGDGTVGGADLAFLLSSPEGVSGTSMATLLNDWGRDCSKATKPGAAFAKRPTQAQKDVAKSLAASLQ